MDIRISNIKPHILRHLIFVLTLFLGLCISIISYVFSRSIKLDMYFSDPLPTHFIQILKHNLSFLIIFSIPALGHVYYTYVFLVIFVAIGMHVNHLGLLHTISKLYHLPLEVYAFSITLGSSFNSLSKRVKPLLKAMVCLLVGAIIEFYI